jgi:uncharacterized protein
MNGETELATLLRNMKAELNEGEYVFCTVSESHPPMTEEVLGYFREKEGLTVILPRLKADQLKLSYHFIAAWVTLTVHSSLSAVGLTSACINALTLPKIPCNMVAAYFHDHIFIPLADAEKALICLHELSRQT